MKNSIPLLEIDLSIIKDNYRVLVDYCRPAKVGAVVKADSYGLGAEKIVSFLSSQGCEDFFVSACSEALKIRNCTKGNIYILNGVFADTYTDVIRNNFIPVINSTEQFEFWVEKSTIIDKKLPCVLHVNTGLNRLGVKISDLEKISNSKHIDKIDLRYIISHLANAEEIDNQINIKQLELFKKASKYFPGKKLSFANSSGILLGKEYHCDLVRTGAAICGFNKTNKTSFKNPIKLTVPIIQIQELEAGEFVGYNGLHRISTKSIVATIPIGYADGYLNFMSKYGKVYIDGHVAYIIGKVSMDLITIDVTYIPRDLVYLGQNVEIIGVNNVPDQIFKLCGLTGYEIFTSITYGYGIGRYNRVYLNE